MTSPGDRFALPPLTDALVLAAFEGWNDAGEAASNALVHLAGLWHAETIAELDPDDYYDFQVNRPTVSMVDGVSRRLTWPTTRLALAHPTQIDRDVLLVHGVEPNMRWRGFCRELTDLFLAADASLVVTLGALLADSPHTRPVPVTGIAYDAQTAARMGLDRSRYEGPTGIVGVLQEACVLVGIPAISFWAAVPHYVSQPPNPKATIALLHRVEEVLDIAVPLGELPTQSDDWQKLVNEMADEDEDVREYIRNLEERDDDGDMREASGDAIAKEFERYLRRRDKGGPPGSM